jgi:CRP/FNR family transcriptional regulator
MIAHRLLLMRLGLLESLSEEQISAVKEGLRRRRLAAGETLFFQGERCEDLHLIQDGSLRLRLEEAGASRILGIVPAGQVLGEAGVFLGTPYPCTAEAAEESLIALLHRDHLRRLTDSLPGFSWQLLRLLSRRLVGMEIRVQALTRPDVGGRVGAVLLQLAQEAAHPFGGGPVTLRGRQAEIGQMAGVARETVSRLLTEWSKRGLVVIGRGRLTIPDISRLQAVVAGETDSIVRPEEPISESKTDSS